MATFYSVKDSDLAYHNPNNKPQPNEIILKKVEYSNLFQQMAKLGYYGRAWFDPNTGEVIIANRGTDQSDGSHVAIQNTVFSDGALGLHVVNPAQDVANRFAAAVFQTVQQNGFHINRVTFTGHSLDLL